MTYSFVAYIDESGDDGLDNFRAPGANGGASTWLVISAFVLRYSRDLEAVAWRNEILARMPERKARDLHFAQLNHNQKIVATQCLASKGVRAISVISNKQTIASGIYEEKNQLYFYLTRYLIERISWLCRDFRPMVPEGDGRVRIIFSRRGGMSYPDFRAYLTRLREDPTVRIHWPVVDVDGIDALDHSRRAGLQLADVIASAFASGVELNRYGNCEPRYAEVLKSIVFHRAKNYFSYGVKLVPQLENLQLSNEQQRFIDLFK